MASGILCQTCGIEAPTRQVTFHQNIGMLVMRKHRKISGYLCKQCVTRHFLKMTGTTLLLGPWGTISLIVSPIFILNNLGQYLASLGMPAVPPGATVPQLTPPVLAKLQPKVPVISARLQQGEPLAVVANDLARQTGVTPGQVVKFVIAMSQRPKAQAPTYGFPVKPVQLVQPVPSEQPQAVLPIDDELDAAIEDDDAPPALGI